MNGLVGTVVAAALTITFMYCAVIVGTDTRDMALAYASPYKR